MEKLEKTLYHKIEEERKKKKPPSLLVRSSLVVFSKIISFREFQLYFIFIFLDVSFQVHLFSFYSFTLFHSSSSFLSKRFHLFIVSFRVFLIKNSSLCFRICFFFLKGSFAFFYSFSFQLSFQLFLFLFSCKALGVNQHPHW